MAMQPSIAHFDLDTFFVSVERLKNPDLTGKPLLVGGSVQRGVVSACSYEARKFGVHSAMPMHQALKLCPTAIVVKGSMKDYSYYSQRVTNIINQNMPTVQKASIDEFYVDMTGMDTFFGCFDYARKVKECITSETGLPVSFALASNKIISKIATNECKPVGEMHVLPGTERVFLSPLPIEKIPMVGDKSALVFKAHGIYTIGDMLQLSSVQLHQLLGKNGINLLNKLFNQQETPVKSASTRKSVSCENTFHQNTSNVGFLKNELVRLVEKVGYELREKRMKTNCVGVKIKYDDFRVVVHQCQIEATSYDHLIMQTAKQLFKQLYMGNRLVRLIGVRLSNLEDAFQSSLFDIDFNQCKLYKEMDYLKMKHGTRIVNRASSSIAYEQDHAKPGSEMWFNRNA
jgi:DNA polymerase IV